MTPRSALVAGAAAAFLGVAAGAFGAHGLEGRVPGDALETFGTAVRWHAVHAVALVALAPAAALWPDPLWGAAGLLFLAGIVVFSGSLYALVLTGAGWPGAVAPLGGVAFLAGWGCLLAAAWRSAGGGS